MVSHILLRSLQWLGCRHSLRPGPAGLASAGMGMFRAELPSCLHSGDSGDPRHVARCFPCVLLLPCIRLSLAGLPISLSPRRAAIREMLDTPGPYLLDVMVPHIQVC